nr:GIY-YIG nuclease family protein [Saprospiraceae bacterium]
MKQYYVYILKCADGHYYTGVTNDLERRLAEHQSGLHPKSYTYSRRPVELVFSLDFNDVYRAISFEKQVKGWNRKKKEAIISGNWEQLNALAACKNETTHLGYDSCFDSCFDSAQHDVAQQDKSPHDNRTPETCFNA